LCLPTNQRPPEARAPLERSYVEATSTDDQKVYQQLWKCRWPYPRRQRGPAHAYTGGAAYTRGV